MLKIKYVITLSLCTLLLFGCGSKNVNHGPQLSRAVAEIGTVPGAGDRSIIKTGAIKVEIEDIEKAEDQIRSLAEEKESIVTSSRMSSEKTYAATLKVPTSELENTMDAVAGLGKELSRSINTSDVTEELIDREAELKNLIVLRERMRELLVKATNVEEILKVERELNRIQTRIDSINRRLKNLKGQVEYSRLHVEITQKRIYGPLGYIGIGIWWVFEKLFIIN